MQAYAKSLGTQGTTMVLNPDSEFFRYFGRKASGTGAAQGGAVSPLPAPAQGAQPTQPAQ